MDYKCYHVPLKGNRGFGFAKFEIPNDAKKAIETINGLNIGGNFLYVGGAQNKLE